MSEEEGFYAIKREYVDCPSCGGIGYHIGDSDKHESPIECNRCDGEGKIIEKKEVPLKKAMFWVEMEKSWKEIRNDPEKWREILKERYATGLLTKKEYEEKLDELESQEG